MKTLYHGGKVVTMAEPLYAEAVLVEDGIIAEVGKTVELRGKAGEAEEVDLDGKVLLPGFIDPHGHFSQVATSYLQVSLDGLTNSTDMAQTIQKYISDNGIEKGQWVNARDYDNNLMEGDNNPDLETIDGFAPDNPLVIHHKSGHMGLLNQAALKLLGVSVDTPDIEGGKIEKKNGRLTGYMEENAFFTFIKKIPMPSQEQMIKAYQAAQEKYASYGITTMQEGMLAKEMLPLYDMLIGSNILKLDLIAFPDAENWDEAELRFGNLPSDKHLKLGGIKAFLDGSPQGRTAWMRTPYAGDESYTGYGTMKDEAVCSVMEKAANENKQLICHCNGDGAAQQFIDCLDKMEKQYPRLKELRPVIIHGQLLGRDQLPAVARLGAMVSFFVAHVYHWGDVHIKNFGLERAGQISPAATALKECVKFTFHQDAPVINQDMIETLWCASARMTKNGVILGEDEAISVYEALKAVTVNGAYQYFEEKSKGTIEKGKRADFVILDKDPLDASLNELRNIKVIETIKDGQTVYKNINKF